jgi:uncharacterized protein YndB with AHSA1/START domain
VNEPLATLYTAEGRPVLRFERRLAHTPEKVWKAVTDPAEMSHWFPAGVHTELRVGAPMRFSFEGEHMDLGSPFQEGEILELDPPKVYAFRWFDSVLRFELVPDGDGCLLVFTQTLSDAGTWGDRPAVARQAPGWDACLAWLAARLDAGERLPMEPTWFLERAERYVEEFGLGEGEVREHSDGYLLRFERDLVQGPDQVWAAITEDADPPAVGAAPPLRATNGYVPAGTVTDAEPARVLEYAWLHDGAAAGRVRFELRDQQPIGCRLVLTQTVPARLAELRGTALAAWQTHLELLFAALHGVIRCPWPTERTEELAQRYAKRLD